MKDLVEWKKTKGEKILREIGIKSGQIILDFGSGSGIYSIIASKIVGPTGKIFAMDSDEKGLANELLTEIQNQNIINIKFIKTSGEIEFPFEKGSINVVLWFDILHLLNKNQRKELFEETHRVLKLNGFVSYHATHQGINHLLNIEELSKEMKNYNLILSLKLKRPMFHWAWIEDSTIYNFVKVA